MSLAMIPKISAPPDLDQITLANAAAFSGFLAKTLTAMFGATVKSVGRPRLNSAGSAGEGYFASVLFIGTTFGEFSIRTSDETARALFVDFGKDDELMEALAETLNIVVGQCLPQLSESFEEITMISPRMGKGVLRLPSSKSAAVTIETTVGDLLCLLSIDQMKLDIATSYQHLGGELLRARELAKLGIWTWRISDGACAWSREVYDLIGLDLDSKRADFDLFMGYVHPEDRENLIQTFKDCTTSRTKARADFRIQTAEGRLRHCSLLCESGTDGHAGDLSLLIVLQDVTDQKIADILRIERDAAENANRAKSIFLANISHELRTPMHGILSFAKFGQTKFETAPKEKLKSYFDEIYESGSSLMHLLSDLVDLAKLESGKMEYKLREANLLSAGRTVQAEVRALIESKGLQLEVLGDEADCEGMFDSDRLIQVLRNLVSNAIKFSNSGSTIFVRIGGDADLLRCTVINRGTGIPENELESIFDKFVQSSRTRTGAGGTGLGLAICKEIVDHHAGRIWATSEPQGETTFTFEFQRTPKKTTDEND